MLDITLKASKDEREGFTLKVKADSNEHVKVAQEITQKIIEKIEKITVEIKQDEY